MRESKSLLLHEKTEMFAKCLPNVRPMSAQCLPNVCPMSVQCLPNVCPQKAIVGIKFLAYFALSSRHAVKYWKDFLLYFTTLETNCD